MKKTSKTSRKQSLDAFIKKSVREALQKHGLLPTQATSPAKK